MGDEVLVWNTGRLGAPAPKTIKQEFSTLEMISIIGISVSVASLLWNIHVFNCKKACK